MEYMTIKIPKVYAKQMDPFVDAGIFSSRAEMVKSALTELLEKLRNKNE
jgi:Arc/MetJ-type ribon-helix-helix transcriptional regulator